MCCEQVHLDKNFVLVYYLVEQKFILHFLHFKQICVVSKYIWIRIFSAIWFFLNIFKFDISFIPKVSNSRSVPSLLSCSAKFCFVFLHFIHIHICMWWESTFGCEFCPQFDLIQTYLNCVYRSYLQPLTQGELLVYYLSCFAKICSQFLTIYTHMCCEQVHLDMSFVLNRI